MQITFSNAALKALEYMPLPDRDGVADVWLRRNIAEATDEEGTTGWTAEEVYFRTALSLDYITEHFDELFDADGPIVDEDTEEEVLPGETLADKYEALLTTVSDLTAQVAAIETLAVEKELLTLEEAVSLGWKLEIAGDIEDIERRTNTAADEDEDTDTDIKTPVIDSDTLVKGVL